MTKLSSVKWKKHLCVKGELLVTSLIDICNKQAPTQQIKTYVLTLSFFTSYFWQYLLL